MRHEQLGVNQFLTPDGATVSMPRSKAASYLVTQAAGTTTLLPAAPQDRVIFLSTLIDTTFAAGNGAAPVFSVGQTGTTTKFVNGLTAGTAGAETVQSGVLSANTALIVTTTARTGTTSAGAVTFKVIAA